MRTRSTLTRTAFAAVVAGALGFGVTSANAAPADQAAPCPGYMSSAEACQDCCANWYGAYGMWSSSNKYCACAL